MFMVFSIAPDTLWTIQAYQGDRMSYRPQPDPVPDYTNAFLWMSYLILVMALWVIWGIWGYIAALATCALIQFGIDRFARLRGDDD